MPIQLDIPFSPGDLDPGNTYPIAKIMYVLLNAVDSIIYVTWTYGTEVSGVFTQGTKAPQQQSIISGEDYDAMVSTLINEECSGVVYEGVKRILYDYLLDNVLVDGELV